MTSVVSPHKLLFFFFSKSVPIPAKNSDLFWIGFSRDFYITAILVVKFRFFFLYIHVFSYIYSNFKSDQSGRSAYLMVRRKCYQCIALSNGMLCWGSCFLFFFFFFFFLVCKHPRNQDFILNLKSL